MSKFVQGLAVAGLLGALVLAAPPCLAQGAGSGAGTSPILQRIAERNALTIGHREASVPYSYIDREQKVEGYSVDLCLKVVEAVKERLGKPGLQINYVPINTTNRIPLVANGTIDLECGTTTNTLARHEQVAFSPIFYITGTQLLVKTNSGFKEVEDLAGKRVAVLQGSSNEQSLRALNDGKKLNISLVYAKDLGEGALLVETDRVDAFAADGGQIKVYAATRAQRKGSLSVVGRLLTYDPYSVMIQRGDPEFAQLVSRVFAETFRAGEAEQLYAKWFGPLGIEIDPILKAAFEIQALPR
ncbi:amino acid ABC transporter substrate-binding protein [Bosea sp. 685]|uniref:amino acid ABC transporter substrate-binding protein n=1 Tax=Bosea sp. 685 TaxID=3080057 RepID=UPI0028937287|nr:amino acid ABC transporter substrate-binding protein [Bosea sp. 685]WNJ93112.1 amino acid ABC transporter substrate-binding protein [Bosea sp. 685]